MRFGTVPHSISIQGFVLPGSHIQLGSKDEDPKKISPYCYNTRNTWSRKDHFWDAQL